MRTGSDRYNESARFWAKIFGINFALGVVTAFDNPARQAFVSEPADRQRHHGRSRQRGEGDHATLKLLARTPRTIGHKRHVNPVSDRRHQRPERDPTPARR